MIREHSNPDLHVPSTCAACHALLPAGAVAAHCPDLAACQRRIRDGLRRQNAAWWGAANHRPLRAWRDGRDIGGES